MAVAGKNTNVEYGNFDDDDDDPRDQNEDKSCWSNFTGCLGGMWATRQMTKSKDREIYVRTTLRELVVYVIFLIILIILTFGMTSSTMYYYTNVMEDLFANSPWGSPDENLAGASQMADFWSWAEGPLLDGLYWEYWYDKEKAVKTAEDGTYVLYENKLLGVPRIRQLRVRDDSCTVHDNFKSAITVCYDVYSERAEDKTTIQRIDTGSDTKKTGWKYYSESELDGSSHWGKIATYSGAGFIQDLALTRDESADIIEDLRKNLWINRGTRVVLVDFTVYNANINLFCVVKISFEFLATGGVIPSWNFRTVKLLRYVTATDYFIMACEFIFVFFILYYIVEEVIEIKHNGCSYFASVWNILDIVVIGISALCIAFSVFRYIKVEGMIGELLKNPDEFADFEFLGYWQTRYNDIVAVCIFFAWIKIFKYISFNKTMTQLSSTLSRCAKDIAGFAIMFFIVFFAFAQLGYLLFGTQVDDFRSFGDAIFTLLRTILGDFDFHAIEEANRILGPIFFISYVFFVFFVLLNMFLAIINDTYSEVKEEIAKQKNEFEIADYFKRGYNNLMGKMGKRDKLIDIQNALKLADANDDGELTFSEIRNNLRKCNFSDLEIEMFFSRYDIDGDRALDDNEKRRMLADLEGRKLDLDEDDDVGKKGKDDKVEDRPGTAGVPANAVGYEEFSQLQSRVNRMEHSIGSIVTKIDAMLVKLDGMEKSKDKKRETMSKMLNAITEDDQDALKLQQ